MEFRYYTTESGRTPALEFLDSIAEPFQGQIRVDLAIMAREGDKAPISKKPIKGHKPMWELRIGGFRVFFVRIGEVYWVLGIAKKQNQNREIVACAKRMKLQLGG